MRTINLLSSLLLTGQKKSWSISCSEQLAVKNGS